MSAMTCIVACLQKQDDLCSHYRKWLTAVAECAKALTDSKAAVATAEAEVKVTPLANATMPSVVKLKFCTAR